MKEYHDLLDELEEVVYVSDLETYELYYLNAAGRALIMGDYEGTTCYQTLQGLDTPCPFCTNQLLLEREDQTQPYIWEHENCLVNRYYLLKDKLIDYNGRTARMEMAIDITDRENISKKIQAKLEIEEILLQCSRTLVFTDQVSDRINEVLSYIGSYYQADRAYIFEFEQQGLVRNSYEWCAPTILPQVENLQELTLEDVDRWVSILTKGESIIIPDVEKLQEINPTEYEILSAQGIRSLNVVELCSGTKGGEIKGFLGVDNPRNSADDPLLLESLSFFIDMFIQKRRIAEHLRRMSEEDALTKLNNRNRYTERIYQLSGCPLAGSLGFALLDINGLKQINDQCGHQYGDICLTQVADMLRKSFEDGEVFRVGDDEFAVIALDCAEEVFSDRFAQIQKQCETLFGSIAVGKTWANRDIHIAEMVELAEELISLEKQRAYRAKRVNHYHHKPAMLDGLLKAIEKGEFIPYLQAKCDTNTQQVKAAEVLVRYESTEHGVVSPGVFIPMLEREMIVRYVDFHMFRESCKILDNWLKMRGDAIPLSVNFSRVTLMETDFVDSLLAVWQECPVPPQLLEIEITESADKMGIGAMISLVHRIRALGFRVSVDDFGSQYTNLQLMTELPMDALKIDRSLICNISGKKKAQTLFSGIFTFCRDFDIQTIAEGVETKEQYEMLQSMGCDMIQGYYFARPVGLREFEERYQRVFC